MKDRILVIDVETIGLHGPAFCVGFVLMDFYGEVTNEGILAVEPLSINTGDITGMRWALENVKIEAKDYNCKSLEELRYKFWQFWLEAKDRSIMAADVNWPCEANFISACLKQFGESPWEGPYPLLDIASFRLGAGEIEVMKKALRSSNELPEHHPLMDARQSARQLATTIKLSTRAVNILQEL